MTGSGSEGRWAHGLDYASIRVAPARAVRDQGSRFMYTERHLQCTWYDPSYRPHDMQSLHGEQVKVEDPGRWNLEAGPDFLDAVLTVGPHNRRLVGDVELHVRPRDWTAHQHAGDPRYEHVIAHVTYFPGRLASGHLPANALQIAMKPYLAANPAFAFECIDVTAYPYAARPPVPLPCFEILSSLPVQSSIELLEAAGHERLRLKAHRLAEGIEERGRDQQFYEEVLYALGYKHNRVAFRQLSRRLPLDVLAEESGGDALRAYALLLGVSGLMPAQPSPHWDAETQQFVRELWDTWWKEHSRLATRVLPRSVWCMSGLRPQNRPERRLAAAAGLFTRSRPLLNQLLDLDPSTPDSWYKRAADLFDGNAQLPYWKHHLSFASRRVAAGTAVLGTQRIASMLNNVAIPFLLALEYPVQALVQAAPAEQESSLIRQTGHHLFGRDHNPALYHTGLRQQGLLQIFHDFCLNDRNACRSCKLSDALGRQSAEGFAIPVPADGTRHEGG